MSTTESDRSPPPPGVGVAPSRARRGMRRFAAGMTLYVVAVVAQGLLVEPESLPWAVAVPLALLPMIPALWGMAGWLDAVRAGDELQRRMHSEAGLVALGVTAVVTFSYGFLEVYTAAPRPSLFWVWPVIAASYAAGLAYARRRYQ